MLSLAQQMKSLKPQIRTNAQAAVGVHDRREALPELSAVDGRRRSGAACGERHRGRRRAAGSDTKVVPTTPAGCGATTTNFTNSTPVAIPTGPAVVTSTIVVSGAGPYLFDLDVTTFIQHTFSADLDITITSPAGTVVTLTTDNGAGNDNVFNGTVWDDDANPAGQVPYTTNNGLVTDHAYVNLTLASPLVPEEAAGSVHRRGPERHLDDHDLRRPRPATAAASTAGRSPSPRCPARRPSPPCRR